MRVFAAVAADGSLRIFEHQRWAEWLAKRKGQRVEVELRDEDALRSLRQNRYWWGVVVPFIRDTWKLRWKDGWPVPKEAVHDALVMSFGGGLVKTPLGAARRKSTASMTVEEFGAMIEAVAEYVKDEYGAMLPGPEES